MGVTGGDYTQWTYDARGRVLSENKQIPGGGQFITSFTYNSADLPVTMTYPDDEVVTFTYTNRMLLDSVAGTNTYVFDTQYDSASRMTSRELGNGLVQNYDYYAWDEQGGRLENLSTESLQNFTYQYDAVGNIQSIADSVNTQTQTFDYDELDRLWHAGATGTSGQGGYATETYGYDGTTGNLASKAGVNYTAYDANHKHAVTTLSNGNTYSYDANGNMTTRHVGTQTFNFAYDAENRLVTVSGSAMASFLYDADGQRIKSTMDGATTVFIGSHYEKTGTSVTKYYMAGASRVAMRKDGTLTYLLADHLGSSSISTDASGVRTSELRYKAWGETRFSYGTMPTKYQFTGQYAYTDDPSTPGSEGFGLMYYGARWVDVSLGRFTQPDTIIPEFSQGTQAWDRYAYTNNNPVRYNDPTGHCVDPICLGIVGAGFGFFGSVGFQMGKSMLSGASVSDAFASVDWKKAAVYGVAGAVAGATYGAINPLVTSTVVGAMFAGGVSGLAGGQAAAFTEASIDQISDIASGESYNDAEYGQDLYGAGLLNPEKMAFDFTSAALLGGAGHVIGSALTLPIGGTYLTASSRAANTILPQGLIPLFKTVSDFGEEIMQQWLDEEYEEYQ